jgi:hypothetical protein
MFMYPSALVSNVTFSREEQLAKQDELIKVTDTGMEISFKFLQELNAIEPRLVIAIPSSKVTFSIAADENAELAIELTDLGINNSLTPRYENAEEPIVVTDSGIVKLFNDLMPLNALLGIVSKLIPSSNVNFVTLRQFWNA